MQPRYSVISIPLNTYLGEKISIGLVMYNSEQSFIKFSFEKLTVIKELIQDNQYFFLRAYFKQVEEDLEKRKNSIFIEKRNPTWINESYISYLNRYTNNLVEFSTPSTINIEMNYENFRKIFEKYIFGFKEETSVTQHKDITSIVGKRLYRKIENQVNINAVVTKKHFSELFAPVELNFIGKNSVLVAGQTIDFEKKTYFLESDLSRYISFGQAANYTEEHNGMYYIIGKEPKKNHYRQHLTWENIRNNHLVTYVDIDEVDQIEEYIKEHNVKPLYDSSSIDQE